MNKSAASFSTKFDNVLTHGTPNPDKPVSRVRAGMRNAFHGALTGGAAGAGVGYAANKVAPGQKVKYRNLELSVPGVKSSAGIGAALGAARGFHRGIRGLGPVKGTRVKTAMLFKLASESRKKADHHTNQYNHHVKKHHAALGEGNYDMAAHHYVQAAKHNWKANDHAHNHYFKPDDRTPYAKESHKLRKHLKSEYENAAKAYQKHYGKK